MDTFEENFNLRFQFFLIFQVYFILKQNINFIQGNLQNTRWFFFYIIIFGYDIYIIW